MKINNEIIFLNSILHVSSAEDFTLDSIQKSVIGVNSVANIVRNYGNAQFLKDGASRPSFSYSSPASDVASFVVSNCV